MGVSSSYAHDGYINNISSVATGNVPPAFNNFTFNPLPGDQTPAIAQNGAITGWSYNGNGEAVSMGSAIGSSVPTLGFGWDGLGRLSSTALNGATETYAYLPNGCRIQLLDSLTPANNRRFAYSMNGQMLTEFSGSGSTWYWQGDVIYLGSLAIAEIDGNAVHELHSDHLGTPRIITNGASGAVEGTQAFGPFGESMGSTYTTGYLPLTGYTGHVQTDPSGLIYMRGRFYSPAWHRFLNSDQGADPNQLNQSAYCSGNPMGLIDPSGLDRVNLVMDDGTACYYDDQTGETLSYTDQKGTTYYYDGAGNILGSAPMLTGSTIVVNGSAQTNVSEPIKTPDYVSITGAAYLGVGGGVTLSIDRWGRRYWSLTKGFGMGRGGSIVFGTIADGSCDKNSVAQFLNATSFTFQADFGAAGGFTTSSTGITA